MKYYGKDPQRISRSLWIGTLIALAIYLLWQASTLGTIPREQFKGIIAGGSNVGTLVEYLHRITASDSLNALLTTFSNLAVASSFLGVTLGLFDYLADLCKFDDSHFGRFKTALLTFVPPTIGGLLFPNGFIASAARCSAPGAARRRSCWCCCSAWPTRSRTSWPACTGCRSTVERPAVPARG